MKTSGISVEQFNGVAEFLKAINSRPTNKVFSDRSLSSETNSYEFTKTHSYAESADLMAKGYKEGLDSLNAAKNAKITASSKVSKAIPQVGIVGHAPHVPNAIAGIPQSMISTAVQTQKSKVVSILYDCTDSCNVKADDFIKSGRNLLDLIVALEAQGCRVALDIMICACTSKQKVACVIRVKDHRQPINPLKISYTLIHTSFFRRQGFKWIETCPLITDLGFAYGYGYPLRTKVKGENTAGCREFLTKSGVLSKNMFFTNIDEARRTSSNEELAQKMGMDFKAKKH
jgi:hypothetical protein